MRQRKVWIWFAVLVGLFSALALLPVTWAAPDQNALRQSVPTLTPIGGLPTLPPLPTDLPTVVVPTVDLPSLTVTLPPVLATATKPAQPVSTATLAPTATATPSAALGTPTGTLTATVALETATPTVTQTPSASMGEVVTTEAPSMPTTTVTPVEGEAVESRSALPLLLGGGGVLLMGLGAGLFILARRRRGAASS